MSENLKWKELSKKACDHRDATMADVEKYFPCADGFVSKHLDPLPEPLPLNVTGLPKEYLNPFDFAIIETDPIVLLEEIAAKKYTSMQVAAAYMRASVLGQRVLNCVTEFIPEIAHEQAKFLDEYIEEKGEVVGPLHGLPISLKDMVALKGHSNSFAITALVDNITDYTSSIVTILKKAGANFYQRTTQPQFLMHMECHSNIYGITENPFNRDLTCGGSSGGEGAALGFGSSCVGLGTDIGGSIRGPAAMQGMYGFKPTSNRLPLSDCYHPITGAEAIAAAIGPLGRTLAIAELVTTVILAAKPHKTLRELSSAPWSGKDVYEEIKSKKKLVVGVMPSDNVVTPQPPVQRAMKEITEKLKAAGSVDGIEIEVVSFEPYKHDLAWHIVSSLYFEDGCEYETGLCDSVGEPLLPLSVWCLKENPRVRKLTIEELWALNTEKYKYKSEYNSHWKASGIDVLLCPSLPGTAQPHATSKYWCYTSQWNLLDYPGITFPATVVDQELDKPITGYKSTCDVDEDYYSRYQVEKYVDAPVALQLVAPRSEDEYVIEGMKLIEKALKK